MEKFNGDETDQNYQNTKSNLQQILEKLSIISDSRGKKYEEEVNRLLRAYDNKITSYKEKQFEQHVRQNLIKNTGQAKPTYNLMRAQEDRIYNSTPLTNEEPVEEIEGQRTVFELVNKYKSILQNLKEERERTGITKKSLKKNLEQQEQKPQEEVSKENNTVNKNNVNLIIEDKIKVELLKQKEKVNNVDKSKSKEELDKKKKKEKSKIKKSLAEIKDKLATIRDEIKLKDFSKPVTNIVVDLSDLAKKVEAVDIQRTFKKQLKEKKAMLSEIQEYLDIINRGETMGTIEEENEVEDEDLQNDNINDEQFEALELENKHLIIQEDENEMSTGNFKKENTIGVAETEEYKDEFELLKKKEKQLIEENKRSIEIADKEEKKEKSRIKKALAEIKDKLLDIRDEIKTNNACGTDVNLINSLKELTRKLEDINIKLEFKRQVKEKTALLLEVQEYLNIINSDELLKPEEEEIEIVHSNIDDNNNSEILESPELQENNYENEEDCDINEKRTTDEIVDDDPHKVDISVEKSNEFVGDDSNENNSENFDKNEQDKVIEDNINDVVEDMEDKKYVEENKAEHNIEQLKNKMKNVNEKQTTNEVTEGDLQELNIGEKKFAEFLEDGEIMKNEENQNNNKEEEPCTKVEYDDIPVVCVDDEEDNA